MYIIKQESEENVSRPKILTCRDGAYLDIRQADNLNNPQFLLSLKNIIFKVNTKISLIST